MPPDFAAQLRAMAEVIMRVGVNLQPRQPLLITEPYELQGVHPETVPLVEAIRSAASTLEAGCPHPAIEVIQSDPARLRALVEADDRSGYKALVSVHTRRLQQHLARGGAFLFLLSSQPQLMSGLPAERLSKFDRIKWRHLGPVIQRLVRGASQWTLAPAPTAAWAAAAGVSVPDLWETVFSALRLDITDPLAVWHTHLAGLARRRDELNAARHRRIRYVGAGTDLTLDLPRSHAWCTAQLTSKAGVPFVANLPTEEIFSAPHKNSAHGPVRVARPVTYGGIVIEGIELEFRRGRVTSAKATTGQDALQQLLATDNGAGRIGEVALVENVGGSLPPDSALSGRKAPPTWQTSSKLFHHTLLDENAAHHIALGDAYRFCSRALLPLALNSSQVHLDLPLDAVIELL